MTLEEMTTELSALKLAYSSGARRMSYEGKTVEYDDEAGLRRRISWLEGQIADQNGAPRGGARFATFRRSGR